MHGKYSAMFADFRVGTDYDLTKDNMLYALFSTGHKSGGFNDNTIVDGVSIAPTYKPEVLYSTEIGSKNKFLNGNLAANVTAFWYAYSNQQFKAIKELQPSNVEGAAGASSAVIFNASNSRILGVEGELAARLPAGLRVDLAATFLDARFTSGTVADTRLGYDPSTQPSVDLKGNFLPRAPQLSVNYGLSQQFRTDFGSFDWSVMGQTRSVQYMSVFNGGGRDSMGNVNPNLYDKVPSYTRLDINVGFVLPNKRVRIDAFVLNLTDVVYLTSQITTPDLNLRFFNPPRQFGTRLTVQL
jgi:iron complex outermembrane receptor protein